MSINEKCYLYGSCKCQTAGCVVRPDNGCPVYRYFKDLIVNDQYEARLKADMVAMLEDLDLQIDKSAAYNLEVAKVQRLIRDRIDKLKENNDEKK